MKDLVCIIPISNLNNSKSRLSTLLSLSERKELLRVMLKDIVSKISSQVDEIFLVSKDLEVYDYATQLGVSFIKEKDHDSDFLNNALYDSINEIKLNFVDKDILILPSDVPLIKEEHIISAKSSSSDLIISPSRGGGTNLLVINSDFDFKPHFGDMSYFMHIDEAYYSKMDVNIIESFYLSLDVNTCEDLGEILLHGVDTYTYEYLSSLKFNVKGNHGQERLNVERIR